MGVRNLAFLIFMASFSAFFRTAISDAQTAKIEEIKQRIEAYSPDQILEAPIDLTQLEMDPLPPHHVLKGGWDSDVHFGKYQGKPIAIKFYMKERFAGPKEGPTHYTPKMKQSFFMNQAVHDLGYAPKPYGYAVGERAEALARISGLPEDKYFGAFISEKIDPKYHNKSLDPGQKLRKSLPHEAKLESQITRADAAIKEVGLQARDLEYMIDQDGKFYFLDLDQWAMHTHDGIWVEGRVSGWETKCVFNASELLKTIFGVSPR